MKTLWTALAAKYALANTIAVPASNAATPAPHPLP
jgi:hypothetical protein